MRRGAPAGPFRQYRRPDSGSDSEARLERAHNGARGEGPQRGGGGGGGGGVGPDPLPARACPGLRSGRLDDHAEIIMMVIMKMMIIR